MEFCIDVPPQTVSETSVESEFVDIGILVNDFSRSKAFDSKEVDGARACGIAAASSMFIVYTFKYDVA